MNGREFDDRIQELMNEVRSLSPCPQGSRNEYEAVPLRPDSTKNAIQQKMDQINDSLDYLRLTVKYVLFDLEATRRENEYLKKMIGDDDSSQ